MKRWQIIFLVGLVATSAIAYQILSVEFSTSRLQASYFSNIAKDIWFTLEAGPSDSIRFPTRGPYDERLGYTRIPQTVEILTDSFFKVEAQARVSPRSAELVDWGVFPMYQEKTRAGLTIYGRSNEILYSALRPERIYYSFDDIPELVLNSLLFIENREILDERYPYKNPAVEWDRLARAILEKSIQIISPAHQAPGGSTIATQLEKYRHSSEGRTSTAKDKLQQMYSASMRAYLKGDQTVDTRKQIVLSYINSIPLAASPGYGEVNGLGDGLWAWYGSNFSEINGALNEKDNANLEAKAVAYRQVLSLFIAHRRPSYFLLHGSSDLNDLTDEYLRILTQGGIISSALRDAALKVKPTRRTKAPPAPQVSFIERKASNAIRTRLLQILDMDRLYDLDNVDLTVESSIDKDIADSVTQTLKSLQNKSAAAKLGLTGPRTLSRGDPSKVIYSFTLFEHLGNANLLRVQTDNLDKPFDINEGTRLDLGSTAKFRTLVSYLNAVEEVYVRCKGLTETARQELLAKETDPISQWGIAYINANPDIDLKTTLEASMERSYSANPGERFFTGGGLHTFANFKSEDNGRTVDIWEALRHSINLPFIRIMRDVVRYRMSHITTVPNESDEKKPLGEDQVRQHYLRKFADKEGQEFMYGFYQDLKKLNSSDLLADYIKNFKPTSKRLAVLFRYLYPQYTQEEFKGLFELHSPNADVSDGTLQSLYVRYDPAKLSLNDQGYLVRRHPLELWLLRYLLEHPDANFQEVAEASTKERQEVYQWLFRASNKRAQDVRIKTLVEKDAFAEILKEWQRLGYPFHSIVPSYASAIGSSGDRPAALATLMGIIVNDGIRYPELRLEKLHFAKDTPFETVLKHDPNLAGERVINSEVAKVVRKALTSVVEDGTARRVKGSLKDSDGNVLTIGGKTGTGDHRYEVYGKGGNLISSKVISRTATFVFFVGKRFFGTVTAHVKGQEAAHYDFTSALAAELLKILGPAISPLFTPELESVNL